MKGNAVIVDPQQANDWIVPRRVMCAFFWVGIILLFTGIILLVTSKHKQEFYQSWGAILLGLGFCLLLICFILCLHAYCVITVSDDEVPNAQRSIQQQIPTTRPSTLARQKAPLKQPPNFKIPTNQPGSREATLDRRRNFNPSKLKTISENCSPGGSRSDIHTSTYGATAVRADHIRTCVSAAKSRPPTGKNVIASSDTKSVHYTSNPPSVSISVGDNTEAPPSEDAESGYENSVCTPRTDNGSVTFSLNNEEEQSVLSSKSNSSVHTADGDLDSLSNIEPYRTVPMPILRHISKSSSRTNQSPEHSPKSTRQLIIQDNPAHHNDHHSQSSEPVQSHAAESSEIDGAPDSYNSVAIVKHRPQGPESCEEPFGGDLGVSSTETVPYLPSRKGKNGKYSGISAVDEEVISPEYRQIVHTEHKQEIGRLQQTAVYTRPVVTARVTQLPSDRRAALPNGAPPQLSYSRQHPISAVHAYPARYRKNSPYAPLNVQVDSPNDQTPRDPANNFAFRPMPPIEELHSVHHQRTPDDDETDFDPTSPENLSIPRDRDIIRPFERNPTNLLRIQSSGFMGRGLNASATVYLNPEDDISDSKMSIYDNLNYIRL